MTIKSAETESSNSLISHHYANVNGIRLHYAESGGGEDLVILLHGFPDRVFKESVVRKGAFSDTDIQVYREALSRPGAVTAAVNYRRAVSRTADS